MKNSTATYSRATGSLPSSSKLKIFLLVFAFVIIGITLWYTHGLVRDLNKRENDVARLYAESLEYLVNGKTGDGDFSFVFSHIIGTIDFPIILSDKNNEPISPYQNGIRNIAVDTTLSLEQQRLVLIRMIGEMDRMHQPMKVAYQDTIILNYVHYGESSLVTRLRWLPYVEMSIAALFLLIAYISFSYIKRNEQSNIWVGMSRETAHQLGTPLSSMLGWVELLKSEADGKPKELATLVEMENDVHRLQKIADRFSKIGSRPDLHKENINELIGNVIRYFERRLPHLNNAHDSAKRVQLVLEKTDPVSANINRELFEWVIENLTKNAIDAIETNNGSILYSISESGTEVFVDVSDTGKGIDPKHRKDVFRPGFSTKKRGWGLGLSLAQRIVEIYHHGKLSIKESPAGYKTTFRIKLQKVD
jgi:signal transduction histidine kinase